MESRLEERELRLPSDSLRSISITSKNYRVRLMEGEGDDIVIRYADNRFRRLNVEKSGASLYLEEEMAVTLYGFFRLVELLEENLLTVSIPEGAGVSVSVETQSTGIEAMGISVQDLSLSTGTGQARINGVSIKRSLTAVTSAGRISCLLPGSAWDYDIECSSERKDIRQPYYPHNPQSGRKVVLRGTVHAPELSFMG